MGTLSKNCANFWTQLVKGEQHTLQESSISDSSSSSSNASQQTDNLTPGTIEVKPKSIHGGHVACILALLATNKVRKFAAVNTDKYSDNGDEWTTVVI